jgi:hypothetical protein
MAKREPIPVSADLPFKITAQTKGAQKAFRRMTRRYGSDEGTRIFLERAEEHGVGNTVRQKANSIYKKGGKFGHN